MVVGAVAGVAVCVTAAAGVGFAGTSVAGVMGACAGDAAGFDAAMVDMLVASAAAAIASGSVAAPDDVGAATTSAAAIGAAMVTATGAAVAVGCDGAAGSAGAAASAAGTISEAASLTAALTMPDFAAAGFAGAAPGPGFESVATGCAAVSASCEGVLAALLEEDAVSRGWRLSEAADVSSERCCGAGRSLRAGSAALLSINDEKLSGTRAGSALADRDVAFCRDRFAAVSDVTLNTGDPWQ
jgi:hypothetical protein